MEYDVFICHASEDKATFVNRFVEALRDKGIKVWYDDFSLKIGDHIRESIDRGLSRSRFGLVVFSPAFFAKKWPKYELDGLVEIEHASEGKVILPIWHDVTKHMVSSYSPSLAGRYALDSRLGLNRIVEQILTVIGSKPAILLGSARSSHTWRWVRVPVDKQLTDIRFVTSSVGWIVGHKGTLLSSHDSGFSWSKVDTQTSLSLFSLEFHRDASRGCVVGQKGLLLETRDGGGRWAVEDLGIDSDLTCASLCDGDGAICVVGSNGIILRGAIGISGWGRIPSPVEVHLWMVHFSLEGQVGCIVGANGTIMVSEDGGLTWTVKTAGMTLPLYSCHVFADQRTICVAGDDGLILVSHDRGKHWEQNRRPRSDIENSYESWLNCCDFSRKGSTGWIVGTKGIMLNSLDGGATWSTFRLEEESELVCVWFQDERSVWCLGDGGVLLSTK